MNVVVSWPSTWAPCCAPHGERALPTRPNASCIVPTTSRVNRGAANCKLFCMHVFFSEVTMQSAIEPPTTPADPQTRNSRTESEDPRLRSNIAPPGPSHRMTGTENARWLPPARSGMPRPAGRRSRHSHGRPHTEPSLRRTCNSPFARDSSIADAYPNTGSRHSQSRITQRDRHTGAFHAPSAESAKQKSPSPRESRTSRDPRPSPLSHPPPERSTGPQGQTPARGIGFLPLPPRGPS